jgi:hypothetical protein
MTDINLEVSKLKEEAVGILDKLIAESILVGTPMIEWDTPEELTSSWNPHNEHVRLVDCLVSASLLEVAAMLNATRGVSNPSYSLVEEEDTL